MKKLLTCGLLMLSGCQSTGGGVDISTDTSGYDGATRTTITPTWSSPAVLWRVKHDSLAPILSISKATVIDKKYVQLLLEYDATAAMLGFGVSIDGEIYQTEELGLTRFDYTSVTKNSKSYKAFLMDCDLVTSMGKADSYYMRLTLVHGSVDYSSKSSGANQFIKTVASRCEVK